MNLNCWNTKVFNLSLDHGFVPENLEKLSGVKIHLFQKSMMTLFDSSQRNALRRRTTFFAGESHLLAVVFQLRARCAAVLIHILDLNFSYCIDVDASIL